MTSEKDQKERSGSWARPLVLGIETSCDDTACALVDGAGRVLTSVVSSQLAAHRPFGGVVPEIASREHLKSWPLVSREALARAGVGFGDLDVVAATRGPGLVGSLLVGLSLGKALAYALDKPFHAVHHLAGHLYSPFLEPPGNGAPSGGAEAAPERFTGLVLSGGHTALFAVDGEKPTTLGETRDDAIGEVFDKVGKRLGLPYPQGPRVDVLAEHGDPEAHPLPVPTCGDSLDFSYSGLKSQALVEIQRLEQRGVDTDLATVDPATAELPDGSRVAQEVLDLLAGFRRAAVDEVLDRCRRLHRERLDRGRPLELLAVSGGAAANRLLRRELTAWAENEALELRLVPLAYSGDNAAMIAYAALLRQRRGISDDPRNAEAASRVPLTGS